jgi:phosphoglycerol transferase MdoB-like AlkP superfamily enzyme
MTDAVYEMVNGYLYGLRKTDQALGHLVSELEMNDEPFVLVFFGDHLPLLNNDYEGYRALGYNIGQDKDVQAFLNHYETPFFIWSNKAARELLKSCGVVVPSGNAPEISTCFLPVELMKYMGMAPPPYFEFLAQLEKSLPVITNYYYKQDGGYVTALSPENQELISQYRKLQHYMMFGNDMPLLDKAAVASH